MATISDFRASEKSWAHLFLSRERVVVGLSTERMGRSKPKKFQKKKTTREEKLDIFLEG